MKSPLSLVILIIFFSSSAFATVDRLAVNHMSHQLFRVDEDHSTGWIGWESIPDGNYKDEEEKKYNPIVSSFRYTAYMNLSELT